MAVQSAQAITIDFSTDDGGTTLVNGQSISTFPDVQDNKGNPDTVFEFGNLFNVSTLAYGSDGHEGAAIFDSTPGINSSDPDLWVGLGNIMILQNDDNPATTTDPTYGLVFDTPNDERSTDDEGSVVFDFLNPVEMQSITMIDINGNAHFFVYLEDSSGNERHYDIPMKWTVDISAIPGGQQPGGMGFQVLDLQTLAPQPSESLATGGDAIVSLNDPGYDPLSIVRVEVHYNGGSSSGAIDNLTFVPEPASLTLLALGLAGILKRKRQ
jgi:hypothetical protein